MMDRTIREQIIGMLEDVKEGFVYIKASPEAAMLEKCIAALQSIEDICRAHLSAKRYTVYGDIFDGVLSAAPRGTVHSLTKEQIQQAAEICTELMDFIAEELRRETEIKKEIVFLPYKASMWDSLESIWRAAAQDEYCNTYVVPIPYADRNPDQTAQEWHCEIGLFPKDVPVLDYNTFDLEGLHPDVIYIHNPYDNRNSATSVDSMYYSSQLRKYTDMLVYVPYFIVGDRWPENHTQLACYPNMDKMVVQREHIEIAPRLLSEMKETDVLYMEDFIPPDKMVPLGTPKIDRVFYCEQHKTMPQEWSDFIQGRRTILYNTSISGVLGHGKRFLRKMEYVFNCFAARTDVALLWRPHPLIETAIQSVSPELYNDYMKLKNRFIEEHIGVLDTTPDIDMAIAAVDAYIGESSSSVVQLFGFAGKPIFFTDEMMLWNTPTEEEKASVRFGCVALDEKNLWFTAEEYNTFCRMDRVTGRISPLLSFGDHPHNAGMYNAFIREEDIFYFAPGCAREICIYNSRTKETSFIPFENPLEYGNFAWLVPYKQYIFFIPSRYPALLRYDKETGKCKYYKECIQEVMEARSGIHDELLGPVLLRGESTLVLPFLQTNKVLEFDMETADFHCSEVGPQDTDCCGILPDPDTEDVYWMFPWKTRKIRRWHYRTGECEIVDEYPEGFACGKDCYNMQDQYMFSGIVPDDGFIWLFPNYGNMVLRLNLENHQLEEVDLGLPYTFDDRRSGFYMQQSCFFSVFPSGEHEIMALSSFDRSLLILNTQSMELRIQPCRLAAEDVQRIPTPIAEAFGRIGKDIPYAVGENPVGRNIEQYIDYVRDCVHDKAAQQAAYSVVANNADGTCGTKVHQYIMEQISK